MLDAWVPGAVATTRWLKTMGISPQHTQKYVANQWLEPVANGVFKRPAESLTWEGALYSLQVQRDLGVHVGALTALSATGAAQYLRLGREAVFLFSEPGVDLPTWFKAYAWPVDVRHAQTKFLPADLGVRQATLGGFDLKTSAPERAILECLHLAPNVVDLVEVYEVLDGLRTLRPALMQSLLDGCASIKVKRLFLYMAEKAALPVLLHLRTDALDLGSGNRALAKDGVYVAGHRLTLPKALVEHE